MRDLINKLLLLEAKPISISPELWDKEVRNATYNDDRVFGALAIMLPDDFLQLAEHDPYLHTRPKRKFDNSKFNEQWLPRLHVDKNGKVLDHEGRGRAATMIQHNMSNMPVVIILPKQMRSNSLDDFPTVLTGQDSDVQVRVNYVNLLKHNSNPLEQPLT